MKKGLRIVSIILIILLAFAVPAAAATTVIETNSVHLLINDTPVAAPDENLPDSTAPYSILYNDVLYLPIRQIGGMLDLEVEWDGATRTATINNVLPAETPEEPGGSDLTEVSGQEEAILQVFFFDVGQADCILVRNGRHAMLIDAGNTGQDKLVLSYLAEHEVYDLDYLIATHPHADHIGSMSSVIYNMGRIGEVIMPDVSHTTQTYKNLLAAIEERDIALTMAQPGQSFSLGSASVLVLAPAVTDSADLNHSSVVLRVEFGNTSFLFTGDAGTKSESAQLNSGFTLKSDVLKVGHHGSRTSSSQEYLNEVAPRYAVISIGTGNKYGHPHSEAMARLAGTGAAIYRTDENGTIILESDGEEIYISVESEVMSPVITVSYIGNKNSKVFHLPSCRSLPQESNAVVFAARQEALDAKYSPCGACKP